MNYVDVILLAIILLLVWADYKRGFIISTLLLLSWIGGLFAAFLAYQPVSNVMHRVVPAISFWAEPISFILSLMIARIILELLVSKILKTAPEKAHDHLINKAGGVIPGLVNGLIWAALIATMFLLMPLTKISKETRDSRFSES